MGKQVTHFISHPGQQAASTQQTLPWEAAFQAHSWASSRSTSQIFFHCWFLTRLARRNTQNMQGYYQKGMAQNKQYVI